MTSQHTSRIPAPGKKKSFLPAPVKTSAAPVPDPPPPREPTLTPRDSSLTPRDREPTLPPQRVSTPEQNDPFQIGDRVCIGGIKFGTLQYFGETHIAPGVWCGVELDEPEGNHDGQVQGRRYFTCENKHGIFAPLDKVALLEEDIYFEDDYVDSEIEEPVISPRRCRQTESRGGRGHDVAPRYGLREYKTQVARASSIPKVGGAERHLVAPKVGVAPIPPISSSHETLSQTSPSRSRGSVARGDERGIRTSSSVHGDCQDSDDSRKTNKPSQIPGFSRLPKYSSASTTSLSRSASSSEHLVTSEKNTPITSPLSPEYEKIDDELSQTYTLEGEQVARETEQSVTVETQGNVSQEVRVTPDQTYSNGISVQLKCDSRQYLNLTFDPGAAGHAGKNLPDVVASNSPSPEGKEIHRVAYRDMADHRGNTTADTSGSDILEATLLDDINLIESLGDQKQKRESLSALSNQFGKLKIGASSCEEGGVNMTAPCSRGGGDDCDSARGGGGECDSARGCKEDCDRKRGVGDQCDSVISSLDPIVRSTSGHLHTEIDSSMMKSLDDASRKLMMDSGISEMTSSLLTESMTRSHQSDNIHALLARSVDGKGMMDSGISEFSREFSATDLRSGQSRSERPVSLISTTSADTGYVPDTDSECGTKTTSSPVDWQERLGDPVSMTESQIIQYQDSFKEEVKNIINGQISIDSDVSGSAVDTETDQETSTGVPQSLQVEELQQDQRSSSSHNSEDDRIEADQAAGNLDDDADEETLDAASPSPSSVSPLTETVSHSDPCPQGEEGEGRDVVRGDSTITAETDTTTGEAPPTKHPAKADNRKPKAASRLADYINAPPPSLPQKQREEKKNTGGKKVGERNKTVDKNNAANVQKTESARKPKVEKEPPKVIKRTPPKSKWGSIMSQIDAKKKDEPVKVKTEVKSRLQEYLSTPAPPIVKKEKPAKKETKPRSVITHTPKPDYSKVKSRLSVATPTQNPGGRRGSKVEGKGQGSGVNSTRSSHTDLSNDGNHHNNGSSKTPRSSISTPLSKFTSDSRRSSVSSLKSEKSQGSVKTANSKTTKKQNGADKTNNGADKTNNGAAGAKTTKKTPTKSTIPAVTRTPKRVPPKVTERSIKKDNSRPSSLIKTPKTPKLSNQNRTRTLNHPPARGSGYGKSSQQPDIVSNSLRPSAPKEVARLESLCETRTKELNGVRLELKATTTALDAMTCLIRYLTEQLDAFSCPQVKEDLQTARDLHHQAQGQIEQLEKEKRELEENVSDIKKQHEESVGEMGRLQEEMASEKQSHETSVKELTEKHERKMADEKEKVENEQKTEINRLKENHEKMHRFMKSQSEREVADLRFENQSKLDMLMVRHLEEIQELRNKHDIQMEELHKQHRDKLENITYRFECIKTSLGDKVDILRGECEELKFRAKQSEDALLRDTDVKVQMALAPYRHLPEEVESLKTVVEMKNEEILKLRKTNMDLEKQLDELPIAREKIISLQQKIENLDAIVNIKSGHEKQLHDKVQILMSKYAKESKANKRLSMDYEELMYKLAASPDVMTASQESLFKRQISRSPPGSECSSPDLRRKARSPFDPSEDLQSPSRLSRRSNGDRKSLSEDTLERKINRRSQTFVLEKNQSPSRHLSPNKPGSESPMSASCEYSDGNQLSAPPSDSTDTELSLSLNELGVGALEDSLVSLNSGSPCVSDYEGFESPQKQRQGGAEEECTGREGGENV